MKRICKSSEGLVYLVKDNLYKIKFFYDYSLINNNEEYLSVRLTKLEPTEVIFADYITFYKSHYNENYRKLKSKCIKILKKIDENENKRI